MISKFFNFTVKRKMIAIFTIGFIIVLTMVIIVRATQIRNQTYDLLTERLHSNAVMTFGIFETVQTYTMWMLELVASHARESYIHDTDMEKNLSELFYNMNSMEAGVYAYENILVFDRRFNLIAVANPTGDTIDFGMFYGEHVERMTRSWTSTAFESPSSGRRQILFTNPIMDDGIILGMAAIIGNTEMFRYFKRDFVQGYDSFVSVADSAGYIFFSDREVYIGRHINELGILEAFGEIPMNSVFMHTSALTGVDMAAYVTRDSRLGWTIISSFDTETIESTPWLIFISLMPTVSGVLITLLIVMLIIHHSLKSLQALAHSAKLASKGDISVRFDVSKNDEIGQVSDAFLAILKAHIILGNNFKNAERAMAKGDTEYRLSDSRLGGVFDEMLDSTNNIVKHIQKSMHEAQAASQAKSDFLSKMSHEIRTPMNAILGMAELVLREETSEQAREYAMTIKSSSDHLLSVINDILDLAKVESGKMEIVNAEYFLHSTINDVVGIINTRIQSPLVQFFVYMERDMPNRLFGDEVRVRQVLLNILNNAVKYTSHGRIDLDVSWTKTSHDTLLLTMQVKDTGIGIKQEDIDKLFAEFSQFDVEKNRNVEGSGLGLAISRNLVELMGGTISAESTYGQGSVFSISIPQKYMDNDAIKGKRMNIDVDKGVSSDEQVPFTAPGAKVLVVDDVPINLIVTDGLLQLYDIGCKMCESGREAIIAVQQEDYDLVFMDHMMPGMDGLEAVSIIRGLENGKYANLPIIALSANAIVGAREMFLQSGFNDFLPKPTEIDKLHRILEEWIPPEKQIKTLKL